MTKSFFFFFYLSAGRRSQAVQQIVRGQQSLRGQLRAGRGTEDLRDLGTSICGWWMEQTELYWTRRGTKGQLDGLDGDSRAKGLITLLPCCRAIWYCILPPLNIGFL